MTERIKELVELALKGQLRNKTRTELVKALFIDKDGDINLSNLELQDFDGNLYMHSQTVKKDLLQHNQAVINGYAFIGNNNFVGVKEWKSNKWVITKKIDPYATMSREELIAEIEKLKGDK